MLHAQGMVDASCSRHHVAREPVPAAVPCQPLMLIGLVGGIHVSACVMTPLADGLTCAWLHALTCGVVEQIWWPSYTQGVGCQSLCKAACGSACVSATSYIHPRPSCGRLLLRLLLPVYCTQRGIAGSACIVAAWTPRRPLQFINS
jgi:hypothetical protein